MKSISFKRHIAYACIASFAMSSAHSQVSGPTPSKSVPSEVNNVLTPVVVTATRFEQPLSEVSVVVDIIGRKQIEQSGASNIVEFLDTVSGLSVNRLYGRAGIDASVDIGSLGTSGAQNVLVLIDGQRVNSSDSSGVRFAQVPMSSIERIEIRKANGGVLYGDRAQGGVINIITRTGQGKDVHLSTGSFGYKKADAYIGFKLDDLSGGFSAMTARSDGYRANSSSKQDSAQLKLNHISEIGKISLVARSFTEIATVPGALTLDEFKTNLKLKSSYSADVNRSGESLGFKYQRDLSDDDLFVIDALHQNSKSKSLDTWGTDSTIINKRTSLSPEYRIKRAETIMLLGSEFFESEANTDSGKQVSQKSQSFYAQVSHPIRASFFLDGGTRFQKVQNDFKSAVGGVVTSFEDSKKGVSIGLRQQFTEHTALRIGALTGFRFPNADELYYFGVTNPYPLIEINPNIRPMATQEYFLELRHRYQIGMVNAHYRKIRAKDEIDVNYGCTLNNVAVGCNQNLYDTERTVLSLNSDFLLFKNISLKSSVDFINSSISSGANAGNRIPMTPTRIIKLGLEKSFENFSLLALANHRNSMMQIADPGNLFPQIPSRTVMDLGLNSNLSKTVTMSAWIRNALNKSYFDSAQTDSWAPAQTNVYPMDGRSFFLNLKAGF